MFGKEDTDLAMTPPAKHPISDSAASRLKARALELQAHTNAQREGLGLSVTSTSGNESASRGEVEESPIARVRNRSRLEHEIRHDDPYRKVDISRADPYQDESRAPATWGSGEQAGGSQELQEGIRQAHERDQGAPDKSLRVMMHGHELSPYDTHSLFGQAPKGYAAERAREGSDMFAQEAPGTDDFRAGSGPVKDLYSREIMGEKISRGFRSPPPQATISSEEAKDKIRPVRQPRTVAPGVKNLELTWDKSQDTHFAVPNKAAADLYAEGVAETDRPPMSGDRGPVDPSVARKKSRDITSFTREGQPRPEAVAGGAGMNDLTAAQRAADEEEARKFMSQGPGDSSLTYKREVPKTAEEAQELRNKEAYEAKEGARLEKQAAMAPAIRHAENDEARTQALADRIKGVPYFGRHAQEQVNAMRTQSPEQKVARAAESRANEQKIAAARERAERFAGESGMFGAAGQIARELGDTDAYPSIGYRPPAKTTREPVEFTREHPDGNISLSDERAKDTANPHGEQRFGESEMAQANRSMAPYSYEYKPGFAEDEGQKRGDKNVGPIAQNMKKDPVAGTVIIEDPHSGLLGIDKAKGLKLVMGGLADVQMQLDQMKGRRRA